MAKKLIFLLLLIPIIVMICLFAATKTISNLVDVSVTGLEIVDTSSHIYLDLDKGETYTLSYAVYPTNAKNKDITVSSEAVEGKNLAVLDFSINDSEVKITPKTAGSAKVYLTTVDGGFKDSVLVHVESTALQSIECSIPKSSVAIGESVFITTAFFPSAPSDTVCIYESDNPKVATVNENGVIKGVGKGKATIKIISEYNPDITDTLTVEVYNKDILDLVEEEVISFSQSGIIPIYVDESDGFNPEYLGYKVFDKNGNEISDAINGAFEKQDGNYSFSYSFTSAEFIGSLTVELFYDDGIAKVSKKCTVSRVQEMQLSFAESTIGINIEQRHQASFTLTPSVPGVIYTVTSSNENVTASMNGTRLILYGNKVGVSTVTLTAKKAATSDSPEQIKSASVDVVVKPRGMNVSESAKTYGIENLITLGKYEYDYSANPNGTLVATSATANKFALSFVTSSELGVGFLDNFKWISDTPGVSIDKNGVISIDSDIINATVGFKGVFSYATVSESTETFYVRCLGDGVNVYTYKDLLYATRAEHPVVLRNTIKDDFGYINGAVQYTEMHTTYDDTYYKNVGNLENAKVKILIEFKNDLYGNGYAINAHNVAYGLDSDKQLKSSALFQGPLDFVAMYEEKTSIHVKGQDNICFALYEGVTVNNVELRGCDLTADDGKVDLVDLSYTGTTVEVLGDNVNIEYSRLTNGRTVLRAFGDVADDEKVINLNVKNSVLSGAREFIMRVGSNCFVEGTLENPSPNLPDATNSNKGVMRDYRGYTDEQKAYHDEKFIKTFITVKNSVFKDAGLFAIGMDAHFAGPALANGPELVKSLGAIGNLFKKNNGTLVDEWIGLAKTSYGAKLTFDGDVQLCSWKDLENVDSSTLISVPEKSVFSGKIDFDVKTMISTLSSKSEFKGITANVDGATYVHAGIAFFGGGKNYSVFDSTDPTAYGLIGYSIDLSDVNRDYFVYAAGYENFYFFMYSANSNFTPKTQEEILTSGKAYDCIYKK